MPHTKEILLTQVSSNLAGKTFHYRSIVVLVPNLYLIHICSMSILYLLHKRVPCQVTCEWSCKQWPDGSLGLGLQCTYICTTTTNKGLPFRSQFLAYAWPFDKLFIPLKFSQKLERKQTKLFMVKIEFSIQFGSSIKSTVTYTVETGYLQFLKGSQGKLYVVLFSIALYNLINQISK